MGWCRGRHYWVKNFHVIAPMFAGLFIASLFVFLSVLLFGPLYLRLSQINRGFLYAFIAMISMVGVYASSFSFFQMWVALAIGMLAYFMRRFGYPVVPALMGVILGPYFEEFLRRSLIVSEGDPTIFLRSPVSVCLLVLTLVFVWLLRIRPARKAKLAENKLTDKAS